ncbi:Ubiquitin-conjugating enzyme, E2 [Cynara cardunculus var. scolymus]|uniref:Ubiquitin-conjugating enzyme, E2 n=1 Tax=Cynara cardunculus var. scolymus TaxID=59895 RepID=A0A118K3E4_CYNCS|nr:Ubiquitin-conjugating enzyme, E2 [Cynara cardunculus var. scolymus]
MAEKACVMRLQKEYRALCKEPVSHIVARPSPNDILDWRGFYYGKIKFPPEYPFKPPGISMTTPNGRFMTQKKICLSIIHPESWNPMWSVSSATFRKLFPEYVEKYEEQRLCEQPVVEAQESTQGLIEKREEAKRVETPKEEIRQARKASFPTWMLLLLVSFVGLVMALPLLQL